MSDRANILASKVTNVITIYEIYRKMGVKNKYSPVKDESTDYTDPTSLYLLL